MPEQIERERRYVDLMVMWRERMQRYAERVWMQQEGERRKTRMVCCVE